MSKEIQASGNDFRTWPRSSNVVDEDTEFLRAHHILQGGHMFDHVMVSSSLVYGISDSITTPFWNNALVTNLGIISTLDKKDTFFEYYKRNPALYFSEGVALQPLEEILQTNGWEKMWRDAWMTYKDKPPDTSSFAGYVDLVTTGEELSIFLQTLRRAFLDNDRYANPYGPISEAQVSTIATNWDNYHNSGEVKYFIVFDKEKQKKSRKPVAVATLTNYKSIGYISSVGTLPDQRFHGYGRAATLGCVSEPATVVCTAESIRQGNRIHTLTTEHGKGPYQAFLKMGFRPRLVAGGWIKKQDKITA